MPWVETHVYHWCVATPHRGGLVLGYPDPGRVATDDGRRGLQSTATLLPAGAAPFVAASPFTELSRPPTSSRARWRALASTRVTIVLPLVRFWTGISLSPEPISPRASPISSTSSGSSRS